MNISNQFGLPEPRFERPRSEPDYYGASDLVASMLNIALPPPVSSASWLHGWRFQKVKYTGELILRFNSHVKKHLIAKPEHASFLRDNGYTNIEVVGMPLVYFLDEAYLSRTDSRIPNSLLVMPPHSTKAIDAAPEERNYVKFIKDSVGEDTFVCFCLHRDCETKGYWINTLKEFGIPYVTGASIEDRNGLKRMVTIFRHFEAMTTNTFGSHIVQASLCGLKVSVCGPIHEYDFNQTVKATRWLYRKADLLAYGNLISGYKHDVLKEQYPQFFCAISDATPHQEWAIEESGYRYKRDWPELAKLLGWDNRIINKLDYHSMRYLRLFKRDLGYYAQRFFGYDA